MSVSKDELEYLEELVRNYVKQELSSVLAIDYKAIPTVESNFISDEKSQIIITLESDKTLQEDAGAGMASGPMNVTQQSAISTNGPVSIFGQKPKKKRVK